MSTRIRSLVLAAALAATAAVAAGASAAPGATLPGTQLAPVKSYLLDHTTQLHGFTKEFRAVANRYYATAKAASFG